MTKTTKNKNTRKGYLDSVLNELVKEKGYSLQEAREITARYVRNLRRRWGYEPNAWEFAEKLDYLNQASKRVYNPSDPHQIDIAKYRKKPPHAASKSIDVTVTKLIHTGILNRKIHEIGRHKAASAVRQGHLINNIKSRPRKIVRISETTEAKQDVRIGRLV